MKITVHSDQVTERPPIVGPLPALIEAMPDDAVYLIQLMPDEDRSRVVLALRAAALVSETPIQIRGNGRQLAMNRMDEGSNGR
jgi:hypothetical protein